MATNPAPAADGRRLAVFFGAAAPRVLSANLAESGAVPQGREAAARAEWKYLALDTYLRHFFFFFLFLWFRSYCSRPTSSHAPAPTPGRIFLTQREAQVVGGLLEVGLAELHRSASNRLVKHACARA